MTTEQITSIADVIRHYGEFAHGGDNPEKVAAEWLAAGFDADTTEEWLKAGCFDAGRAAMLRDAGMTADRAGRWTDKYLATIGYKFSNGDLTLADALRLAEMDS